MWFELIESYMKIIEACEDDVNDWNNWWKVRIRVAYSKHTLLTGGEGEKKEEELRNHIAIKMHSYINSIF